MERLKPIDVRDGNVDIEFLTQKYVGANFDLYARTVLKYKLIITRILTPIPGTSNPNSIQSIPHVLFKCKVLTNETSITVSSVENFYLMNDFNLWHTLRPERETLHTKNANIQPSGITAQVEEVAIDF